MMRLLAGSFLEARFTTSIESCKSFIGACTLASKFDRMKYADMIL